MIRNNWIAVTGIAGIVWMLWAAAPPPKSLLVESFGGTITSYALPIYIDCSRQFCTIASQQTDGSICGMNTTIPTTSTITFVCLKKDRP